MTRTPTPTPTPAPTPALTPTPSPATPARGDNRAGALLVEPSWLAEHLDDPDVRVIEVDVSAAAYRDWHIDGAQLWNIYSDLKDGDYRTVERSTIEQLVLRSGIGPGTTVVFYGYAPALGVWILNLLGHDNACILDCSRETWRSRGWPWTATPADVSADLPSPEGALSEMKSPLRADLHEVQTAIGRRGVALIDVRSLEEYQGERFWPSGAMQPDGRAGHVPGAVHQPLDGLYNADGSFRTADELRPLFSAVNLDADDEVILYCTIGGRAATAWFVLNHLLGRDHVRIYDGSWAEWGRTPGVPVDAS